MNNTAPQTRTGNPEPPARNPRFVIPKKGRLKQAFDAVMAQAGLAVARANERHDYGMLRDEGALRVKTGAGLKETDTAPTEILTMRNMDALRVLAAGAADMAVVGRDMLAEFNAAAEQTLEGATVIDLNIAQCALYIAAPRVAGGGTAADTPAALQGRRVATSFPALTTAWLAGYGVQATMVPCDGGVEDMVRLGLADAVCDLVETGASLAANDLEATMKIMDSGAVIVIRAGADADVRRRMEELAARLSYAAAPVAAPVRVPA